MKIDVLAPAKTILFGEHFVVYGAPGIVVAIEPQNELELLVEKGVEGRLEYTSTLKEAGVSLLAKECVQTPHPIAALYCYYAKKYPKILEMEIRANVKKAWELKGVGNSASLSACFAYGIRSALGLPLEPKEIFEDVQIAEKAAHGTPSGIDAAAAVYGGALNFKKSFEGEPSIEKVQISVSEEYSFVLMDTFVKDKERSSTKEMIEKFAKENSIENTPDKLTQEQRDEINSRYMPVYEKAIEALGNSNADLLAKAMDENHSILRKSGVSSQSIEQAIEIAKKNGAIGAKLTAAGGVGGAAIALCKNKDVQKVRGALQKEGFGAYRFNISEKGVNKK